MSIIAWLVLGLIAGFIVSTAETKPARAAEQNQASRP